MKIKIFIPHAILVLLTGCSGQAPKGLGWNKGRFSPCSARPCLSSTAQDQSKKIEPVRFSAPYNIVYQQLKKLALGDSGSKLISERPGYFHIEYHKFFGVDDLEVYVNPEKKRIELKTQSRSNFDFGSNKKRAHHLFFRFVQSGM